MTATLPTVTETCCPPLLDGPLSAGEATQLATAFKVLADPARLRLLSLIAAHPSGEACNCELIEPLGLSQPTVSHHLKKLSDAGLLEREQRGKWAYFSINTEAMARVAALLDLPEGGCC